MKPNMAGIALCIALMFLQAAPSLLADTSNGNDFALYYTEAKTNKERAEVLRDAAGRPHYFRYLQIMEMEWNADSTTASITAFEPSSLLDVRFKVVKRESLAKLLDTPESKVGDAIAIKGIVRDVQTNTIVLGPVIVEHKDRLSPKRGKEFLYEVDPSAHFYSFTGGKRAVNLTYKDRDLLQFKGQIMAQSGKDGWAAFLEREVAKRNKERAAQRAAERAAKQKPGSEAP